MNLAAFVRYYVRAEQAVLPEPGFPLIGFVICLYIWWSLRLPAKVAGLTWLAAGLLYGAWKTNRFRYTVASAAGDEELI